MESYGRWKDRGTCGPPNVPGPHLCIVHKWGLTPYSCQEGTGGAVSTMPRRCLLASRIMARPVYHVLSTLPVVWWAGRRWGPLAALVALIGGVGIDIDHLVDYALLLRIRRASHLVVPLHGWEYPLILLGLIASGAIPRWLRLLPAVWQHRLGNGWHVPAVQRSRAPDPGGAPLGLFRLVGPLAPAMATTAARCTAWPPWEMLVVVLTVAWTLHLALDSATNGPRQPKFYSLLYRMRWAFNVRRLGWHEELDLHDWANKARQPWWRYLY